ncbi:uncharacterized protein [Procambarus clarkii]|uniref:uncharacterized protein n=1 Tax=Procambarus clarkii TaxID=6728 RepID=UPI0037424E66
MQRAVVLSCLVALSLAGDHAAPHTPCQPRNQTILITRTEVNTLHQQVTQYDFQYGHYGYNVTSVILVPSTVTQTQTFTSYPPPDITTQTSYITATNHFTEYSTSLATVINTRTTQLLATEVQVKELTITQTAIVPETITQTLTIINHETAFSTVTITDVINAFVTKTKTEPFTISETSYQSYTQFVTDTVTSFSNWTVEVTTTLTQHQFVTKCKPPKITYDH